MAREFVDSQAASLSELPRGPAGCLTMHPSNHLREPAGSNGDPMGAWVQTFKTRKCSSKQPTQHYTQPFNLLNRSRMQPFKFEGLRVGLRGLVFDYSFKVSKGCTHPPWASLAANGLARQI